MLVTEVIRQVQRRFGDDLQAVITNQDIFDWINDAEQHIARETLCLSTKTAAAASSQWGSNLDTAGFTFLKVIRATYDGRPLKGVSLDELDSLGVQTDMIGVGSQAAIKDVPGYFYVTDFGGNHSFYMWPQPVATDSKTVEIMWALIPASASRIDATGDTLNVPTKYHQDVVNFCVMRAHERNENYTGKREAQAEFQAGILLRKDEEQVLSKFYPTIVPDPEDIYQWL